MTYAESLTYLDTFVNWERSALDKTARDAITLDPVRRLAARFGNPERSFPSLHVAGTKGKGSTCAFASSILHAAGLKVGLYTSPHLQDVRERIAINGQMISQLDFARTLERCRPVLEDLRDPPQGERRPTYFEILTHLAFQWFAEQRVDVAVVEVGLGGRLDATNIVQPIACAITSISRDHTAILGETLREIAGEKAGILKPGVPVFVARQKDEAADAIRAAANTVGSRAEFIGPAFRCGSTAPPGTGALARPRARVSWEHAEYNAELALLGHHQIENWAIATRLADHAHRMLRNTALPHEAVVLGSRTVRWPGRFEEVSVPDSGALIILDGAHNDHSLKLILEEFQLAASLCKRVVLFGCAKDKDVGAMLRILAEHDGVDEVVFTSIGHARGSDPAALAASWAKVSDEPAHSEAEVGAALRLAADLAGDEGAVLATGSLYLVGALKDCLKNGSTQA